MIKKIIVILFVSILHVNAQKVWKGTLNTNQLKEFYDGEFTIVKGDIVIGNSTLETLEILKNLTYCKGTISITNNKTLTSLKGLHNLIKVKGKISIIKNENLNNYCALNSSLVNKGIKGVKVRRRIYEKLETVDNKYNPSMMDLQNHDCHCSCVPIDEIFEI